ncbi:MAG: peptidylprolyl isomerase [Robiginitomaculum sp.]|nr:peptidylprolyl isomerase [Robiginitomaculum sp.]
MAFGNTSNFASKLRYGHQIILLALIGVILVSCQDKVLVQDKTPFSASVVRLGDTVVAEIDGTSLYLSDIENAALAKGLMKPGENLTPAKPIFHSVLDELIDQRLLALEALRRSLDQNDETRRRLAVSRERILSNVVVETLLAEKVTEDAILRMYEEQAALQEGGEQVRARHILVETEDKAKELKDLVEKGGSFSALAKEFSIDISTQDLGGDLGYFSRDALREDMASVAFATQKGSVSETFKTSLGWHLIKVEDRRVTPKPRFEEIKPEITSYMTYAAIEKMLKTLRENSSIELKLGGGKGARTDPSPNEIPKSEKSKSEKSSIPKK